MAQTFKMTPGVLRLIVAAAVAVNRTDHMTTEAFAAGDAGAELAALTDAYAETDAEVKRAPVSVGGGGNALRALHAAVEEYLLKVRNMDARDFSVGCAGLVTQTLAVRLAAFGVTCTTREDKM